MDLVDRLSGKQLRFSTDAVESSVECIAIKNEEHDGVEEEWQFLLATEVLKDAPKRFLRITGAGVLDWGGGKSGPHTKFRIAASAAANGAFEVRKVKGPRYISIDAAGHLISAKEPVPLTFLIEDENTTSFKQVSDSMMDWCGSFASWICSPSKQRLKLATTKEFWQSLGGALFTLVGSSLFWVGFWTEIDQAIPQSASRDWMYIAVGITLSLLTDTLGVSFNTESLEERLDKESMLLASARWADRRADELESLEERGKATKGEGQAGSADNAKKVHKAIKNSRAMAQQKFKEAADAKVWPWSTYFGLVRGDKLQDKISVGNFLVMHGSVTMAVGLIGSALLWIGLCNFISMPLDAIVGVFNFFWDGTMSLFGLSGNSGTDDDYYVPDVGILHFKNTLVDVLEVIGACALMNLSCGLDGLSQASGSIKDPYAWLSLLTGIFGGCMLWVAMSDLLETQLTIEDESGMAAQPQGAWREFFYIAMGFLCQVSTELVAGAALTEYENEDPWQFPTTYDIVSTLGGVLLNSGVWTLIDTQIVGAWQNCSNDGTLTPPTCGWPSCHTRNFCFFAIGLFILLKQRGEMDEAGVTSSPIMTLAVRSARKTHRLEERQERQETNKELFTVAGSIKLRGQPQGNDTESFLASLSEELSHIVHVPDDRIDCIILDANAECVKVEISVRPNTWQEVNFLRKFGVESTRQQEQERVAMALKEKLSKPGDIPKEGLLSLVDTGAGFVQLRGPNSTGFKQQAQIAAKAKAKGKAKAKAKSEAAHPKAKGKGKAKAKAGALTEPLLPSGEA